MKGEKTVNEKLSQIKMYKMGITSLNHLYWRRHRSLWAHLCSCYEKNEIVIFAKHMKWKWEWIIKTNLFDKRQLLTCEYRSSMWARFSPRMPIFIIAVLTRHLALFINLSFDSPLPLINSKNEMSSYGNLSSEFLPREKK